MPSKGGQKEINELKRLVIANGFKLVPSGSGHMKLLSKKGSVVTDDDGPVIISSTASDHRARDMHVKRLLAVGALKADPWKPTSAKDAETKQEGRTAHLHNEEGRARRRAAELAASKEREENTLRLRARIEPFVVAIGGWGKKGVQTELGRTCRHFLVAHNRVEAWSTDASAEMNAHTLKKGGTLSDRSVAAWNLFMDEIERAGDTVDARRKRYFELVAQMKGVGTDITRPKPGPAPETPTVRRVREAEEARQEEQVEVPAAVEPQVSTLVAAMNGGYKTPTLALRALAEMMVGTPGDALVPGDSERRERALSISEEILDMEIRTLTGRFVGVEV